MNTNSFMRMQYGGVVHDTESIYGGLSPKEFKRQADKLMAEVALHPPKRRPAVSNRARGKSLTPAQRYEMNQVIGNHQIVQAELKARALKLMANDIRKSLRGLRSNLKQIAK